MAIINKTNDPSGLPFKEKIKFLAKDTLFYGGLRSIALLAPFLTIPFLTRYFKIEEYGLYDSLLVFSTFVTTLLVFGQDSALARWFYQVDDLESKKKVITQSLTIQVLFFLVIIPLLLIFSNEISSYYLKSSNYSQFIFLVIIQSLFGVFLNFIANTLKWTFSRKKYALISILNPILLLISLFLLYYFKFSLMQYIITNIIASFCISILGLFLCKNWIKLSRKFEYFKNLFSFAWPYGLICVLLALFPTLERKVILDNFNFAQLGLYALAYKISQIVWVGDNIFQMAWGPFALSIFKQDDAEQVYNTVLKIYFVIFILIIFLLNIFSSLIVGVAGTSDYNAAAILVLPLSFALFFNGLGGITGLGITLSLKSYYLLIPYIISILLFLISTIFLIPYLNIVGVAMSLVISNLFKMLIMSLLSRKVYSKIRIKPAKIVIFSVLILFLLISSSYLQINKLLIATIFIFFYPALIYIILNRQERNYIINKIKR